MAQDGIRFRLVSSRIGDVDRKVHEALSRAVEKTVFEIVGGAKQEAPVLTGFLRNSIEGEMTGPLEGRVSVGAEYARFVNDGTRHHAPRPFFTHAVEKQRSLFADRLEEAARGAVQ